MKYQDRCPCGGIILADTEEWPVMLCHEHYTQAMRLAAQAWCDKSTADREMDSALAEAFAKRLGALLAAIALHWRANNEVTDILALIGA